MKKNIKAKTSQISLCCKTFSPQGHGNIGQQIGTLSTDELDQWLETAIAADDVNVGLDFTTLGQSADHVGQHAHLLRVKLQVVQSIHILLQYLKQNKQKGCHSWTTE